MRYDSKPFSLAHVQVTCTLKGRSYPDHSTGSQNNARLGTGLGQGTIGAVRPCRWKEESQHRTRAAKINNHHPRVIKLQLMPEISTTQVLNINPSYLHKQVCICNGVYQAYVLLLHASLKHSCHRIFQLSTESSFLFPKTRLL